jgi:hypothetical protein
MLTRYDVVFWRDADRACPGITRARLAPHIEVEGLHSLTAAKAARRVCGDLVVYHKTLMPVVSEDWLWDYEVTNPTCYAREMQRRYGLEL